MQNKSMQNCATPSRCCLKLFWHLRRTRTWSVSSEEDWKFALATNLTSSLLTFEIWFKLNFDVATALVYRECWNILIQRDWENSPHKVHFESGVRLGVGSFNLVTCLGLLISVRILNVILIQPIYADFFFAVNFSAATKNIKTAWIYRVYWNSGKKLILVTFYSAPNISILLFLILLALLRMVHSLQGWDE